MMDLINIDISECCHLNCDDFIECVINLLKVEKLNMSVCDQFTEQQIIDICTSLPNLEYFDASCCVPITHVSAYVILCNVRSIRVLKIVPKYGQEKREDWSKLMATFLHVDFGDHV